MSSVWVLTKTTYLTHITVSYVYPGKWIGTVRKHYRFAKRTNCLRCGAVMGVIQQMFQECLPEFHLEQLPQDRLKTISK